MIVIKKKTFSYLSHNRKSGTIAGLLAQFGRIGRAKGVETYFAFNPFCEKKTKNWHNGVAFPPVSSPTLDNRKRTIPKYDFHRRLKKSFLFLLALNALVYLSETGEWSHHPLGLP